MKYILVCDESGAKGRASVHEKYSGEVGVCAGFLVSRDEKEMLNDLLEPIFAPHRGADGKLHITDLGPAAQQEIRTGAFEALTAHSMPCFFEGIHVEGFAVAYARQLEREKSREQPPRTSVRVTTREPVPVLHHELFLGLFTKVIAHLQEIGEGAGHLDVLTDPIDAPVVKELRKAADAFINPQESETVKGWNPDARRQVVAEVRAEWSIPDGYSLELLSAHPPELEIDHANSALTCVADIISNSLNHHFRSREPGRIGDPLNRAESVAVHGLQPVIRCLWTDPEVEWLSDAAYAHPVKADRDRVQELLKTAPTDATYAEIRRLVQWRAFRLSEIGRSPASPLKDWFRAKDELGVPADVHV